MTLTSLLEKGLAGLRGESHIPRLRGPRFSCPSTTHNVRTQPHRPSSFHPANIAGIERARNTSRLPLSAKRYLAQASRRSRDQEALHHAKNGHSSFLDLHRHSEATNIMKESSECGYQCPRPGAGLGIRVDPFHTPSLPSTMRESEL